MGGGKTHLLVGFGLLARHPDLRWQHCGGLPHAQAFETANIAAFNGRNNPDHYFWGEIATQLGKGDQFKAFWTAGPKAPDERDWLKLFDGGPHPHSARRNAPVFSLSRYAEGRQWDRRRHCHPRLKNVIALFKENEQFKQTRGLIELVSRLLRSVWERPANDVFLIGPQHFGLGIQEVRDKLTETSGMRDVIAKDLWDGNASAHAQVIDLKTGKEAATQVGSLLLTASLSTPVNAVKGLTREEMVECLVSPLREPSEFLAAFEELEKSAWYLHHTPEGRYYFDRQENLTKLLQSLAHDAPEPQVDELIRYRLTAMFKPTRKTAYDDVLPLPRIEDIADRVRKGRILLIVSPDSKIPPEEVQKFFESLSQKNNLCVLTGDKTAMGSVEKAARQLYAAHKADGRIPQGHPQRDDLEKNNKPTNRISTPPSATSLTKCCSPSSAPANRLNSFPRPWT
jgi:hypothetical protein